jgi:malonyl-CoA O-methyltransferase
MLGRVRRAWSALRAGAPVELPVREAYALWAPSYAAEAHNPFMAIEQRALLQLLPDVTGAVVLDLACGTGRYAKLAGARGAAAAFGLDLSQEMLRPARAVATGLARGDLVALPFRDAAAGVVICGLAVGHLPELGGAIAEAGRVLKPGGVLLYSDFHPFAYHSGRRRTFAADGHAFTVEHHAHLYAAHQAACRGAGLQIEAVLEPAAPDGVPAVLVIRARKPA